MIRGLLLLVLILMPNAMAKAAEAPAAEPSPELRAFAQELVNILETQDRQALADLIDFEHIFVQSCFSKCEFDSHSSKAKFYLGLLRASRDIESAFYKKLLPESELVSLLRVKKIAEQASQVTIRIFTEKTSVYYEFEVHEKPGKNFRIVDVSPCSAASSFSKGVELGVLPLYKYPFLKSMGPYEPLRDWLDKNQSLYADFATAYKTEDQEAIVKLYPQLAPAIQKIPIIEYRYYLANTRVEKPALKLEDMQAYHKQHQDLGTLCLIRDYCHAQNEIETLLATYDQIDQLLGKDPLNNWHRAHLYLDADKLPEAYQYAQQLIKDYPDWRRSHITLMVFSLFDRNFKLTLQQLQILRDKHQLNLVELIDTDDDYEDFRKSSEYTVWKKESDAAKAKQDQK